jgi:tripartite-type tricarboxylate transporter receptor subunit TctC
MGPLGLSADHVNFLSDQLKTIINQTKFKTALEVLGNDSMYMSPKELEGFIKLEHRKWGEIVKRSGVKPE